MKEDQGGEPGVRLADGPALGPLRRTADFVRRLYTKAGDDNIFFLAGAISFNVLVAVVPLLLFAVGTAGMVLTARVDDPAGAVLDILVENLPAIGGDIDLATGVRDGIQGIVDNRTGLGGIGFVLLIWLSTRLVGSLRTALREVFDISQDRGVIRGKVFDTKVVLVGGLLLMLNVVLSAAVTAAQSSGVDLLGLEGRAVTAVGQTVAFLVAFTSIWVLFLGVYRFLPARWLPWRTALIAATVMAVSHELLKWAFGWYATDVADYRSTYGNLVTMAVLVLWIYYEAVVFILAGEIAQVWTMRRARRVRTRVALARSGSGGPAPPPPPAAPLHKELESPP